jgi:hypothetical protein
MSTANCFVAEAQSRRVVLSAGAEPFQIGTLGNGNNLSVPSLCASASPRQSGSRFLVCLRALRVQTFGSHPSHARKQARARCSRHGELLCRRGAEAQRRRDVLSAGAEPFQRRTFGNCTNLSVPSLCASASPRQSRSPFLVCLRALRVQTFGSHPSQAHKPASAGRFTRSCARRTRARYGRCPAGRAHSAPGQPYAAASAPPGHRE